MIFLARYINYRVFKIENKYFSRLYPQKFPPHKFSSYLYTTSNFYPKFFWSYLLTATASQKIREGLANFFL